MIEAKDIPDIIRTNFNFKSVGKSHNLESFTTKTGKLTCYWGGIKGYSLYGNITSVYRVNNSPVNAPTIILRIL